MGTLGRKLIVLTVFGFVFSLTSLGGCADTAHADQRPFLTAPAEASPGATITVDGFAFQPNSQVSLAVCGDGGLEGSSGCDLPEQVALIVGPNGLFIADITVKVPPVPCPCVVVAETDAGEVESPLVIRGAPEAVVDPGSKPGPMASDSVHTHISGRPSWKSWLGLPSRRLLAVTVANTGITPVPSSPMTVSLSTTPGGTVDVAPVTVPLLHPGQSTTLHVSLPIGPLTMGTIRVQTDLLAFNDTVTSRAETLQLPWALIVLCAALLQLSLLWLRNRIRNHLTPISSNERASAPQAEESRVIDLTETGVPRAG